LSANPYETDLDRNPANYQPLTPLAHLERAALIHPDHLAIIHGSMRISYRHFLERSRATGQRLTGLGIGKGDTVSVMLSNTPAMLEAHHGVPMTGAVLHSINTRLDAQAIAFQLDHADCKVLIVDREFSAVMAEALALATVKPVVIDYDDTEYPDDAPFPKGARIGTRMTTTSSSSRVPRVHPNPAPDEWEAVSLNYTSGTTGNPKGVVYHHRGAA
jgi:fatty-acyl-CoA synthase